MTAAPALCPSCGTQPREGARFCDGCGSPIAAVAQMPEYKQVTVLFADVVHSMDIAASVSAERLRELMAELFTRSAAVVQRYGGTVDKFTGDGIMALFGAPIALEDHALRACLAALDLQAEVESLSVELRVGLDSGGVVAGEIGSGPGRYTAIGAHVGMAQRMESAAPPGGVMLSAATARLVQDSVELAEPENVSIKGSDTPVPAHRLLGPRAQRTWSRNHDVALVGRHWETAALAGILDQAVGGTGAVVSVVGPAGIGKSRLVRELAALAADRDISVYSTFCESHTTEVPFGVVAPLLRDAFGINGLEPDQARDRVRERIRPADPHDAVLLDDLLGIRDAEDEAPEIDGDARRRRLAGLIKTAALAGGEPAVYVIEDVHWIDDVSELMLADFVSIVPQTRTLTVFTYRPEYTGVLANVRGAQTLTLAPLNDAQTSALTTGLLGDDSSLADLSARVVQRAGGNPFFAQEMVRDLAERGVIEGERGVYVLRDSVVDVDVPATLQATIGARIDRLGVTAKRALNAAAVIGTRFGANLLARLLSEEVGTEALADLVDADLVDQVTFGPDAEFVFRHPLIRSVAYESQLTSDRAETHRRLAAAIQAGAADGVDAQSAVIANHLQEAGDLRDAFSWHMRAGSWFTNRDIIAARNSWARARDVADQLPTDDADRPAMRLAPRTLLCGTAWRVSGSGADIGFDELRELANAVGDRGSLAIAMAGMVTHLNFRERHRESSALGSELIALLDAIGDPVLTVGLSFGLLVAKMQAGEFAEARSLADRCVDLAAYDPGRRGVITGAPLSTALIGRALIRSSLGLPGYRADAERGLHIARSADTAARVLATAMWYGAAITNEVVVPDEIALRDTAVALELAEKSGDDFSVGAARFTHGACLAAGEGQDRAHGVELLRDARRRAIQRRFSGITAHMVDVALARVMIRDGDLDDAVAVTRATVDYLLKTGEGSGLLGPSAALLVEALARRGQPGDVVEAQAVADKVSSIPTKLELVMQTVALLRCRALLARADGDEASYRRYVARYREAAIQYGFEGHLAVADAMA